MSVLRKIGPMKRIFTTCALVLGVLAPIHAQGQRSECTVDLDSSLAGVYIPLQLDTQGDNWALSHSVFQITWNSNEGLLAEIHLPEKTAMAFQLDASALREFLDTNLDFSWAGFSCEPGADPTLTANKIWAAIIDEIDNGLAGGSPSLNLQVKFNRLWNQLYAEVISRDGLASIETEGPVTLTSFSVLQSTSHVVQLLIETAPLHRIPEIADQLGKTLPPKLALLLSDEPFARKLIISTLQGLSSTVLDAGDLIINYYSANGRFRAFEAEVQLGDFDQLQAFPQNFRESLLDSLRPYWPRLLELSVNHPELDFQTLEIVEANLLEMEPAYDIEPGWRFYLPMHASFAVNLDSAESVDFPADHFGLQRKGVLVQNLTPLLQMLLQQMSDGRDSSEDLEF